MQFTITATAALSLLSLASAAPSPKCTKQTHCEVARYDPAPANHVCGVVGTAHLTPGELIGETKAQSETECAATCIHNKQCESFAFDKAEHRCLTFRESLEDMGFRKDPTNAFAFYSASCWGTHCYPTMKCA